MPLFAPTILLRPGQKGRRRTTILRPKCQSANFGDRSCLEIGGGQSFARLRPITSSSIHPHDLKWSHFQTPDIAFGRPV
ncbi:hypothetical protein L596_016615 [Steinernema carpocapsae]|uniref:Uncharacterized protein n=1 Tax=Steinernema carpocapsae TaxID=34508 RepID=A0A4U5NIG6_STECR|nr:hypothetical protein L596_016615 [Steinernema carpocapsae]